MKFRDMAGEQYGEWLVLRQAPGHVLGKDRRWVCRCSCGKLGTIAGSDLRRRGSTTRCLSCARIAWTKRLKESPTHLTHGYARKDGSRHRTYNVWVLMRRRCLNPKSKSFKNYGGRGIKICKRWDDYELFLADMGKARAGYTLDRKRNNGPYSPANCRWIPHAHQARNTRKNYRIRFSGITRPMAYWAKKLNMTPNSLLRRLLLWGTKRALGTPVSKAHQEAGRRSILKLGRDHLIKHGQAKWKHAPKRLRPLRFKP